MLDPKKCTLYSGAANGTESYFGEAAEKYGIEEVNYSFEGHQVARTRGQRALTSEELGLKDVSLTYVSKLLNRNFTTAPIFRKVLQSICWQVASGHEIFVIGSIQEDDTVVGGTGWGAEYAKICNKPLFVFDQSRDNWYQWGRDHWNLVSDPVITHHHFTGTGTRFLEDNGKRAIDELFARSFS